MQRSKKPNDPKKQKESYSGNHKCHTIRRAVDYQRGGATDEIICVHQAKDSVHDLELFRCSEARLFRYILVIGDKGYQGIYELHENSITPYKKLKDGKLTASKRFLIFL
ncbi:MAG: transposase family protein [Defluviitaleaceae bacterium]|nr:transposase family protein [Defluviitaleaceae bacterium]